VGTRDSFSYRTRESRFTSISGIVGSTVSLAWLAILSKYHGRHANGHERLLIAAGWLVLVGLFAVTGRQEIAADSRGVTMKNLFLTTRYAWEEIKGFRLNDKRTRAVVELQDGRRINVAAVHLDEFVRGRMKQIAVMNSLIDRLNSYLPKTKPS